ncbi:MFS transporter [Falsiroseomonas oryzae]|uniref:MFS transporter n=1 Tax=Falsiroseomonas oryzae TaxID=2766473 RepID=UPI0022EA7B0F|nr:MFS transporter [Roseomonas sp. MO-31]
MFAERLARALAARGIHYGWVMAGLAFFYVLFSTSALGVPGVLILPMSQELGMTIGELSAPQGLRFAMFGLMAPFAGGLMLRYGPRRMLAFAGTLLLAGLALTATMQTSWQLWLGVGVVLGIAPGLTALQLNAIISSRWFTARRGMVIGLMGGATATGVLVFMPLAAWIAESWGWRMALLPSAIGMAVMLVLCHLFFRNRPQELGLPAYGDTVMQPVPPPPQGNFVRISLDVLALGVRKPVFWILAGAFAICGVSSFGITQAHLVPYCGDIGIPMVTAAWLLAVIGVADLIGTIGSGWLSDRYDNRWLLSMYYGLRGVSLFWLVFSDATLVGLTIFAVIYGLDFIATMPPTVKLTIATFGRETGPALLAWILAAHQLGSGAFAALAGSSRDAVGSYLPAFFAAAVLCMVAAIAFVGVRRPAPAPA